MDYRIIGKNLLNILYPPVCVICGDVIGKKEKHIECDKSFVRSKNTLCMMCGKSLESNLETMCSDCAESEHEFDSCMAAFDYNKGIRHAISEYKYRNKRIYSEEFARRIVNECGRLIRHKDITVIMPVPLSDKKMKSRGFNQAALIAKRMSEDLKIPYDDTYICRTRDTTPMKDLNDYERRKNLTGAFKVNTRFKMYRGVLLVDDIYTTGATLDACTYELKRAGVRKVHCLTMCVGKGI